MSKGFAKGEPPLSSTPRTTASNKLESIDRPSPLKSLGCATLAPPATCIPIFLEWTIKSLNLSPIHYLSIIQTPSPSILPSLPSMHSRTFPSRSGITDVGPQSHLPPLPSDFTLPKLYHLTARPELILRLLQNTDASMAFPCLHEFTLALNEVSEKVEDTLERMYVTLDQIRRLPEPATARITVPSKTLLLSLDGYDRPDIEASELPVDNLHFIALLFHEVYVPSLELDDLKLIPQWVKTSFPSLKGFSLFHGNSH
ncbi:hypothetical protein JAAARDRAFT_322347 [Jaapia argillacea MUCL 33604]|uniref:Uncharacterized protein n=1 Tax=Jaapia argillacea MUCL 33604 TaxID=933084 RepID=A0A067Q0N9_9AGAM|nr:hypothetical protein JAAARDRAFT_322347 [Jaapia argillacea MUCL 33604]